MAQPTPSVPAFTLLAVSTMLSYATFHAAVPLLPLLLPPSTSLLPSAFALAAFVLPSFPLHAIILNPRQPTSLPQLLSCGALLQAAGSLALAATGLPTPVSEGVASPRAHLPLLPELPVTADVLVTGALFVAGLGTATTQFGLVRLITEHLAPLRVAARRKLVGVHLAVLEACVATGTVVSPVLFAAFATTRGSAFRPFLVSGALQLALGLYVTFSGVLRDPPAPIQRPLSERLWSATPEERSYGSIARPLESGKKRETADVQMPIPEEEEAEEEDPGVLYALRHPWVWMILFTMLVSAASFSFLRPVLTPRITDELGGSRMYAALLFSLTALVGMLSESFTTAVMSSLLGIRNTVILGMLVTLAGYHLLTWKSWIAPAVVLLVAGTSCSLVMSVTDLSQTTHLSVLNASSSLSVLAALTFSVGEVGGTLAAGFLYDILGSFEKAVRFWSQFLMIACVIVVTPYLFGLCVQCLRPWLRLVKVSRRRREHLQSPTPSLRDFISEEE